MTTNLTEIYNEWQNNIKFREAFKKNPEEALKLAGFNVSPQDLNKIKSLLQLKHQGNNDNEELDERISK